jgi:hypothetical protein
MKKIIALFLLFVAGLSYGLDGYSQVRMEKVYDSYRARFIE